MATARASCRVAMALIAAVPCGLSLLGCGETRAPSISGAAHVHVEGERVVDGRGRPVWLRGITLGDWNYEGAEPPIDDHGEEDFARLSALGIPSVRLLFNTQMLEDDAAPYVHKASGLAWLDQNIAWAKRHGMTLILTATVPPGGSSKDCGNAAFWEDPENRARFVALWRVLAERYADEPAVAAYGLFDAPNPSQTLDQWQDLATELTQTIRGIDENHALLVQNALSIGTLPTCDFELSAEQSFPRLDDANVIYQFERHAPWQYTAQLLDSSGFPEYPPYPSNKIAPSSVTTSGFGAWLHATVDSRPSQASLILPVGDSPWHELRFVYTVTDPDFDVAIPTLQSDKNLGTAYFDDIVIKEYDARAKLVGIVADLDLESADAWSAYEYDDLGNPVTDGGGRARTVFDSQRGETALAIAGTTTGATWSNARAAFAVKLGHTYEVTGWLRGEDTSEEAWAVIRLDFWHANSKGFDKTLLAAAFADLTAWGRTHEVPMGVSDFGAGLPSFDAGRGGLTWVNDMIDLMVERDLHFSYYTYHHPEWGLYANVEGLPDPNALNQPLLDLLAKRLRTK